MENQVIIPGIIRDLPASIYHDHSAVSSTTLKKFLLPTPAHAKHAMETEKQNTDALICGQVLHCLLLEPHRLDLDFVIEKERLYDKIKLARNGGSKEAWEVLKAEADIRLVPLVSNKVWVQAQGMAQSIEAHPYWKNVKEFGEKELTIFSQIKNEHVKVRFDALYDSIVLDIKSSRKHITNKQIQSTIVNLAYQLSAAMYLEVGQSAGIDVKRFVWVFVESFEPYLCRFVEATPKMLEIGREDFYACLGKYSECKKSGYPGYPIEIAEIDLPSWYETREYTIEEVEQIHE